MGTLSRKYLRQRHQTAGENAQCGKDIRLPEKTRKEEFALYDKLKATLSEESDALFEEFLEKASESQDEAMLMTYKRGMATGMLLAVEAFCEGDEL